MRVSAGHPEASYLFCKVDPTCKQIQGGHMPLGGAALSANELGQIREWILSGAPGPGGGGSGGTGGAGGGGGTGPTYEKVQLMFDRGCGGGSCHERAAAPPFGLDLTAGVSYGNLVGVMSQENSPEMRIAPGQPDQSYLLCKVDPNCNAIVGAHMPLGLSGLP